VDNTPLLMSIEDAARFVGGIGTGTLRRWCAEGLPYVRAGRGGKKLFDPKDLRKYVERLKESVQ
jgi:hypothetical protein